MSTATAIIGGVLLCVAIHELARIADALERLLDLARRDEERELARRDGPRGIVR